MDVSVIIPCYNASRFLRETLDSAIAQTRTPLEIIVVNDGSTDDSAEIARSYGPPIQVISQSNQGESVARNRGIDEARGDWIAFLDADDLWRPDKLARQLAVVDADDIVCVHTNLYYFGDKQGESRIQKRSAADRYSLASLAADNCFLCPSAMLVRRAASPRFPTWTRYGEDLLYCLELVSKGAIRFVEEPLTGYRQHSSSQSRSIASRIGWREAINRWLDERAPQLDEQTRQRIDSHWIKQIVSAAWAAKRRRNWKDYWLARQYLKQFADNEAVADLVANRIYPPWVYVLVDQLAAFTRKQPVEADVTE